MKVTLLVNGEEDSTKKVKSAFQLAILGANLITSFIA